MIFRKKSKILGLLGIVAVVFTPTMASAVSLSLSASVAGRTLSGIGLADNVISLSSFIVGWNELDDHPLYSADGVSPTISVRGTTDRSFTLSVRQTLPLDASVDDVPVKISGDVFIPVKINGLEFDAKAWSFDLTFTYEAVSFPGYVKHTLDTSGTVAHLMALHTDLDEVKEGGADLSVNARVTKEATIKSTVTQVTDLGKLDLDQHRNGPHYDRMTTNRLEFSCCQNTLFESGNVTKWEYKLNAFHDENGKSPPDGTTPPPPEEDPPEKIPEPLTILGSVAALGFGAYAERKRKPSNSSEKDNTKDS